jgi:branched-chain amino acid transport system substrate-binding protein
LSKHLLRIGFATFWVALVLLTTACRGDTINCEDPLGCVILRPNAPVRLATLLPTSGETAVWGQELSLSINLAVLEHGGELLGHDIELIPLDSACDAEIGLQAMQGLIAEPTLLGIIGPACSDVATAVLPIVRRNDWLMISPASSLPSLTENQSELAFFRTVPNHLYQATAAAHFAYEQLGLRQAAVFQDETDYNGLLAQQFSESFSELGGIVTYRGILQVSQTELTGMLDEISTNPPEFIYMALFQPEANLFINRLTENSLFNQATLVGGDSLFTSVFANQIGAAATGMFITSPAFISEAYDAFLAQWTIHYDTPPTSPTAAYAYDATKLMIAAIEAVAQMGQNGSLVVGRSALRAYLATSQDVAGLAGMLHCEPTGECAAQTYGVYELDTAVLTTATWPPPLVWQYNE